VDEVPVVSEDKALIDAAAELSDNDIQRALVVDGDRFVGILSATDVALALEVRRAGGRFRRAQA
jgi:CBS domain-containing protein